MSNPDPIHSDPSQPYIGRFAPSPTGPLHFGSLLAALASYLDARLHQGQWLVRMEDLDPPREVPGASDEILSMLDAYGLYWDGKVMYQSQRQEAYQETLQYLLDQQLAYYCDCSRQQIQQRQTKHYDDYCRQRQGHVGQPSAVRLITDDRLIQFADRLQGLQQSHLHRETGDFVIRRKEGLFAYQLAVVVDDAEQGITHIVRGSDLLDSTPRQLYLQQLLGLPSPSYGHIPVIVNSQGQKLSKQTYAPALQRSSSGPVLCAALRFLGCPPEPGLEQASCTEILSWAMENWQLQRTPKRMSIIEGAR